MSDVDLSVILRLLAAAAAGIALGLQRDVSDKSIGVRTLALVSLGAAMLTVAGLRYAGLHGEPDAESRVLQGVMQGVVVGVGFIGAGVILRDLSTSRVHGLTTATTVWIAAALGIACGLADWLVAATGLALALTILIILKWVERKLGHDVEMH
jgi:putative Mg2+ transporter-C (MgtC) family protein